MTINKQIFTRLANPFRPRQAAPAIATSHPTGPPHPLRVRRVAAAAQT